MPSNVPDEFAHFEQMSAAELHAELLKFRDTDETQLSEAELTRIVALHTIARRKASGPPKKKAAAAPQTLSDVTKTLFS